MLFARISKIVGTLILLLYSVGLQAEVYFSRGPNGEMLASDRPVTGYQLIKKRDTMANAGLILANRPISTGGPVRFRRYIQSASIEYGVDPSLVEAVIQVESGFNPNAVSRSGATGLMQLMSKTAKQYKVTDRHNPLQNINGGVEHLSVLMQRFNGKLPLVLAAYNAGATAVEKYKGIPPYPETERYVRKVLSFHSQYSRLRYGVN